MPCMCGDVCCRSCGPAQGNYRCDACGNWSSDGGCENLEECNRGLAQQVEAEHQEWLALERAGKQYDAEKYADFANEAEKKAYAASLVDALGELAK